MAERQSTQQLLWFTLCLKINNFNERIVEWWLISKLSILSRVRHKHDSLECISIGSIVVLRRYFSFYFILCVCFSLDLNFILQKIGQFVCIFSHHFSPDHRRHAIMFLFILGTCYCAIFHDNWTRNATFQVEKGRHVEIYHKHRSNWHERFDENCLYFHKFSHRFNIKHQQSNSKNEELADKIS